jgi:hypothetical protein
MGRHLESFCALEARLARLPLVGTAPRVDVWFLLEYPHPWGNKGLEESHVPESVKQFLSAQAAATSNARIQLIKHPSHNAPADVVFSIVLSREANPVRYTFMLPHYEALLDLDLAAVLSGSPKYGSHVAGEPLYLVCTNARRDPCCASRGLPLYEKLFQQTGPSVWQTTHVGGHRFAANLIVLPHGLYYGRVDDIDPLAPIRAYGAQRLLPDALRGRCCYDPVVQAAEYFLHTQHKGLEIDRYRLNGARQAAPNEWVICFEEPEKALHYMTIGVETTTSEVPVSCGSDQKEPVILYHLKEYHQTVL